MTIDAALLLSRVEDILATELDGEMVLLSIADGKYYGLNGVGSEIWRRLERPVSAGALCDQLTDGFAGDEQQIRQEALALLAKLVDWGLVRQV